MWLQSLVFQLLFNLSGPLILHLDNRSSWHWVVWELSENTYVESLGHGRHSIVGYICFLRCAIESPLLPKYVSKEPLKNGLNFRWKLRLSRITAAEILFIKENGWSSFVPLNFQFFASSLLFIALVFSEVSFPNHVSTIPTFFKVLYSCFYKW